MDYKKISDRISKEFDSYELYFLREKTKKYESRNLELYSVELKEEEGVALRAIKDNRMVFSYSYEDEERLTDALIKNCHYLLPFIDADKDNLLPDFSSVYPTVDLYDSSGISIDEDYKKEAALKIEKSIIDYDKRIAATRNCELQEIEIEAKIINSNNVSAEAKKTIFVVSGMCAAKDKDEVSWYDWQWSHYLKDIDIEEFSEGIAKKAISFLGGEQIETGIYRGILTPQSACDILGILSVSFLAESLYKNKTRLKDKIGEKCFSGLIDIVHSCVKGINSFPFDGEGIFYPDTMVVKEGVFETFLYDTYYGKKYSRSSTGSSIRAGIKEPPKCGIMGLYIKDGSWQDKDLPDDYIVIEELMGTHTANPITGDFSLGAVGYINRGGVKKPFKEVIFSGNVFELFSYVSRVGSDIKFYGTYGSPSLFIDELKISGR